MDFAANTGVGPSVKHPPRDMILNVVGTFNYLEAARLNSVSRFVSGVPSNWSPPYMKSYLCIRYRLMGQVNWLGQVTVPHITKLLQSIRLCFGLVMFMGPVPCIKVAL